MKVCVYLNIPQVLTPKYASRASNNEGVFTHSTGEYTVI